MESSQPQEEAGNLSVKEEAEATTPVPSITTTTVVESVAGAERESSEAAEEEGEEESTASTTGVSTSSTSAMDGDTTTARGQMREKEPPSETSRAKEVVTKQESKSKRVSTPSKATVSEPIHPKKQKLDPDTWNPPDIPQLPSMPAPCKPSAVVKRHASSAASGDSKEPVAKEPRVDQESIKDSFCWSCHKDKVQVSCNRCCRSFHVKCLPVSESSELNQTPTSRRASVIINLTCIPCLTIEKRQERPLKPLQHLSREGLNQLFKIIIDSIKGVDGVFRHPVDSNAHPDYEEKIVNPVSLQDLQEGTAEGRYCCSEQFLYDVEWIVHNSAIYHGTQHPLTNNAKQVLKQARGFITDIESCPDCFRFSMTLADNQSFSEVCSRPHTVVWAKVQGYPFWPAKLFYIDESIKHNPVYHIRFFGSGHERGVVKKDGCFLLMAKNCFEEGKVNKKSKISVALQELRDYIAKFETKFNVKYPYTANPKTPVSSRFVNVPGVPSLDDGEEDFDIVEPTIEYDLSRDIPIPTNKTPKAAVSSAVTSLPTNESKPEKKVIDSGSKGKKQVLAPPIESSTPVTPVQQRTKTAQSLKKKLLESNGKKPTMTTTVATATPSSPNSKPEGTTVSLSEPVKDLIPPIPQKLKLEEMTDEELKEEIKRLEATIKQANEQYKQKTAEQQQMWNQKMEDLKREHAAQKKAEIQKLRAQLKKEYEEKLEKAKKTQWCALCFQQASYYCCWNTSYCSQECQHKDWGRHMQYCQQGRQEEHQQAVLGGSQGNGLP